MKKVGLFLKLFVPVLVMALLASEVVAKSKFIFRDGYEVLCTEGIPERMWQDGDTLQIRGQTNVYRTYSPDSDKHIGTNIAVVNATMDVNTGTGTAWGTFKSMPDTFPGSAWEGHFSGRLTGGLYNGRGIGQGTGELSGMQMKTVTRSIPYNPDLMPSGSCPSGIDPPTMLHNEIRVLIPPGE